MVRRFLLVPDILQYVLDTIRNQGSKYIVPSLQQVLTAETDIVYNDRFEKED